MRYWNSLWLLLIIACKHEPATNREGFGDIIYPADTACFAEAKDSVLPDKVVAFAKTLVGTRYQFGCQAPSTGFDCSGFITYVFNHFSISVPRSSVDFTNEGTQVSLDKALPGDLILFTGTNSKVRVVGHIGFVVANDTSGLSFIHSSSGKENAVIITRLNEGYMSRFVKVIRLVR